MTTLYLIRGVPGSGKSSFAASLKQSGLISTVLEADDYFQTDEGYVFDASKLGAAHEVCQDRCRVYLITGHSVAVSNTSTTEKEVEVYRKLAEQADAKFVSIVMENRHNGQNVHNVPEEKLKQMKQRFSIKL
jgi:predicted kinase